MKWLWAFALVVLTACGAQSEAESRRHVRAATTAPASTTTTAARPTDATGVQCQRIVDDLVAQWRGLGRVEADAVCVDRAVDRDFRDGRIGSHSAGLVKIGYPPAGDPVRWPQVWHDTAAHELGHAWDTAHLTYDQHQRYAQIRGITTGWLTGYTDEDYADTFAAVVGGATILHYIGTAPPAGQVTALCAERLLPC